MSDDGVILEARDVRVAYPSEAGEVVAVDGFDLRIRRGEIVGLIGETGCGKSTAALALLGLVRPPGRFDGGRITFLSREILGLPDRDMREIRGRDISLIVQNPHGALNPLLRIGNQIANVYLAHHPVSDDVALEHAVDMLALVGINDPRRRLKAYPHELSGGMAQRTMIAMALSSRPQLLVADDPTSGLDVTIQAQVLDDMWDSVQQTGSAILLVTQDLGIIANYCDRVAVMKNGRVIEDTRVIDFFRSPAHEASKAILAVQRAQAADGTASLAARDQSAKQPLIEVESLTKLFPIKRSDAVVQAVSDVSFTVGVGESLGLVGESGSGKTTVGRCLLRLVEPTSGEIRFHGEPIGAMTPRDFRRYRAKLQIVFQNPFDALNPRWTVRDILREPLDVHTNLSSREKEDRIFELLDLIGTPREVIDYRPRRLNAGQQQRIGVARAIATNPEFVVLDEPTSALAPISRAEIIGLLKDLQDRLGFSYLFISHDLSTVKDLCHRVGVMYLSQIVEIGTTEQVFGDPQHPYSKALLASVLAPDPFDRRIDREVRESLEGEIPSPINLPKGCYLFGRCPIAVDVCRDRPQELRQLEDGRLVRCWRVTEGDRSQATGAGGQESAPLPARVTGARAPNPD